MHPGLFAFLHARGHRSCGEEASFGGRGGWGGHHGHGHHGGGGEDLGGGNFGVRRPLRFLAYKLELDEEQVTQLATILDGLKIERAQAAVDERRTTSALADAVSAEAFDEARAKAAADERVKSTERVQTAVVGALARLHALLKPEQRTRLAYLLRTGALGM